MRNAVEVDCRDLAKSSVVRSKPIHDPETQAVETVDDDDVGSPGSQQSERALRMVRVCYSPPHPKNMPVDNDDEEVVRGFSIPSKVSIRNRDGLHTQSFRKRYFSRPNPAYRLQLEDTIPLSLTQMTEQKLRKIISSELSHASESWDFHHRSRLNLSGLRRHPNRIRWTIKLQQAAMTIQNCFRAHRARSLLRSLKGDVRIARRSIMKQSLRLQVKVVFGSKQYVQSKVEARARAQEEYVLATQKIRIAAMMRFRENFIQAQALLCGRNLVLGIKLCAELQKDWILAGDLLDKLEEKKFTLLQKDFERQKYLDYIEKGPDWQSVQPGAFMWDNFMRMVTLKGVLRTCDDAERRTLLESLPRFCNSVSQITLEGEAAWDIEFASTFIRASKNMMCDAVTLVMKYLDLMKDLGLEPAHYRKISTEDIKLVEKFGLRLVRAESEEIPCMQETQCDYVVVLDASKLFDSRKHTEQHACKILGLFLHLCIIQAPEMSLKGVYVVVNLIATEPLYNFSYSFLCLCFRFLSAFPIPLNRLLLYGPLDKIGTGWHTALKLMSPSIMNKVVYQPAPKTAAFVIDDVIRQFEDIKPNKSAVVDESFTCEQSSEVPVGIQKAHPDIKDAYIEEHNIALQALVWNFDHGLGWYGDAEVSPDEFPQGRKAIMGELLRRVVPPKPHTVNDNDIPALVAMIRSGTGKGKIFAAKCIAEACGHHNKCKAEVCRQSGLQPIAQMLHSDDKMERIAAMNAIACSCMDSCENARSAHQAGAVVTLISLLSIADVFIRLPAAKAIAEVCCNCEQACLDVHHQGGISTIMQAINSKREEVKYYSFKAVGAVLRQVAAAREDRALSDCILDAVCNSFNEGSECSQCGAALALSGLFANVIKQHQMDDKLQKREIMARLLALLSSGHPHSEICAASALAACCSRSKTCATDFFRNAGVKILDKVFKACHSLNAVLFSGDDEEYCSVASIREYFAARDDAGYVEEYIAYFDKGTDGSISVNEWQKFNHVLLSVFAAVLSDPGTAEETAFEICHGITGLDIIFDLVQKSFVCLQALSLQVITALWKCNGVKDEIGSRFVGIGGDEITLNLISNSKDSTHAAIALETLLYGSKVSSAFREKVLSSKTIAAVQRIATDGTNFDHSAVSAALRVLETFSKGDMGLFHMLRTGSVDLQEKASAAIWNLSVHNPAMKDALMRRTNLGLMENMAFSVIVRPATYKGKIPKSLVPESSQISRLARRNSINVLKVLGKLPTEFNPGPLEIMPPKQKSKSRLLQFRDYLHRRPASSNAVKQNQDMQNWEPEDPWQRAALWK